MGENRYSSTLPLTSVLNGVGWLSPHPCCFIPKKETQHLFYRMSEPQGQSRCVQTISPPTRIQSPDHPARSQSLYQLCHPGSSKISYTLFKQIQLHHLMLYTFHATDTCKNIFISKNWTSVGICIYYYPSNLFQLIIIVILRDNVYIQEHLMLKYVVIECSWWYIIKLNG